MTTELALIELLERADHKTLKQLAFMYHYGTYALEEAAYKSVGHFAARELAKRGGRDTPGPFIIGKGQVKYGYTEDEHAGSNKEPQGNTEDQGRTEACHRVCEPQQDPADA